MENRWSDRRDLCAAVDFVFDDDQKIRCQLENMSLGGVFLSINATENIHMWADVKLVFYVVDGSAKKNYTLPAHVVRIGAEGVGLKFKAFESGSLRALQALMACEVAYRVH